MEPFREGIERARLLARRANQLPVRVVNLTPHEVTVFVTDTDVRHYPSQGLARAEMVPCEDRGCEHMPVDGITVRHWQPTNVTGLPSAQSREQQLIDGERRVYIVSRVVAEAVRRPDVFIPDGAVRDAANRIIGCTGLAIVT